MRVVKISHGATGSGATMRLPFGHVCLTHPAEAQSIAEETLCIVNAESANWLDEAPRLLDYTQTFVAEVGNVMEDM